MILRPHLPATPSLACILKSPAVNYSTRPPPTSLNVNVTRLPTQPSSRRPLLPPQAQHRQFSSSTSSLQRSHYELLGVEPNVSKADLKKQFYVLSKETHPDVNPDNPQAGERFAEISEAYAVLGNDEKRKRYDRDVMPQFRQTPSRSSASRSSGTYAGSRPATGLSKRRGTFRGPPPSFYSQGSAANAQEQARRDQEAWNRGAHAGQFDAGQYTSGPGSWDPTFNPTPVYRTQTAEDARRNTRRAAEVAAAQAFAEEDSQFWAKFIIVSGIVGVGVLIGSMINRMSAMPRGGLTKGDGTRRANGDTVGK